MEQTINWNHLALLLLISLMTTACAATARTQTSQSSAQESAATTNQRSESERFDSLAAQMYHLAESRTQANRTLLMAAEGVPGQTAQLTIPMQNLRDLPDGAKYTVQNGRASVEAERQGENIVVTGKADSIVRRCLYFENQVFRQRQSLDSLSRLLLTSQAANEQQSTLAAARSGTTQTVETTRKPPATWHWWLLTGFLAGGAAAAWLTKTNPLKTVYSLIKKIL